jgi:hypothetical protein
MILPDVIRPELSGTPFRQARSRPQNKTLPGEEEKSEEKT